MNQKNKNNRKSADVATLHVEGDVSFYTSKREGKAAAEGECHQSNATKIPAQEAKIHESTGVYASDARGL